MPSIGALAGGDAGESTAEDDSGWNAGHADDLGFGGLAGHVARGDVSDFVGEGGGELVLLVGDLDQSRCRRRCSRRAARTRWANRLR